MALRQPLLHAIRNFSSRQLYRNDPSSSSPLKRLMSSNSGGGFRHRTHAVSIANGDYTDYSPDTKTEVTALDGWEMDSTFEFDAEKDAEDKERESHILGMDREREAIRRKWIETAKAPVRVPKIDEGGRAHGRGGRKTSTASVWVFPGEGNISVNGLDYVEYFPRDTHREDILGPFIATQTCGQFDVLCHVHGGGKSGQAGAMRHGVARALQNYNPDYRPPMKALGFMTRDPRKVERKKVGLKKARKAPQWVKR